MESSPQSGEESNINVIDNELSDKIQHMMAESGDTVNQDLENKVKNTSFQTSDTVVDHDNMKIDNGINSNNDCDENECEICLTDLPSEVLIHIASFLDSRTIIQSLYQVCKIFHDLFNHDRYWKTRMSQRWKKIQPVFEREDFNWRKTCMEREEVHQAWSNPDEYFHHFMIRDGFFSAVDVVHLMKGGQYLAVGSRDRYLNIFDLDKYDCDSERPTTNLNIFSETKVHKGWIWSMASYDNTLVTGSWDTYVRLWDLGNDDITHQDIKLETPVLGIYYERNFIAACGFNKRMYMIDPRTPRDYTRKCYHQKPVLCITGDSKHVLTGGEDGVVSVYDRTAGKQFKQFQIDSFVNSISYGNDQLWLGDKKGRLHVVDTHHNLFDENTIQTYDVGHTGRVYGLIHADGAIYTGSSDTMVKVIEPILDPDVITTLKPHKGEVARISYNNGVFATAGSDISVGVWLPKKQNYDIF
ncbi:F-box/WD repeat-containing protein 9 [Mactra antiquata]